MTPEEQVQTYLQEAQGKLAPSSYNISRFGLNRFLEYLRLKKQETLPLEKEFIEQYQRHLHLERGQNAKTASQYLWALKKFYEHLKVQGRITTNPVQIHRFTRIAFKDRHYTDEEIMRAYFTSRRRIYTGPYHLTRLARGWKKIRGTLSKLNLRLQGITREHISQIVEEIGRYQKEEGALLSLASRLESLSILKGLLRWMYRNGYLEENIAWGLGHHGWQERHERIAPFELIHPSWRDYEQKYIEAMQVRLRPQTIHRLKQNLKWFWEWLSLEGIQDIQSLTRELIEQYRAKVYEETHLANATLVQRLSVIRYFMNWLEKTEQILTNPCHKIDWPKRTQGLPTRLMSSHDVAILMSAPDIKTPIGLRNRAIFETMYSTGMRAGEAGGIRFEDINHEQGLIKIQEPKGGENYQRVVPIGLAALEWIKKYIQESRPQFKAQEGHERHLFLSNTGEPIDSKIIGSAMRNYCVKQGMRKIYSSHSWRVTCATAMLRNKADVRYVQEQLGHRSLDSTRIYTRLFPIDLKKVHEKTHPREKEWRRKNKVTETPDTW